MQKTLPAILILLGLISCKEINKRKNVETDDLYFQALISPAFDEHAEVTIKKSGSTRTIQFLLRDAYGNDKPSDTFYFKTVALSESQFHKVDTELLQKVSTAHSVKKSGIRDGIWFDFTFANDGDTSILSFAHPQKAIDSAAFAFIENGIDNFKAIFNDTIINDYLYDVQMYIDNSNNESPSKGKRTIDKMRRIKYSH
jgi:hypothetical protein